MTKKSPVLDLAANRLSSYLHRTVANPVTRKSTEINLGLNICGDYKLSVNSVAL